MTQLTELDYESIENAVMETARGRWFLSEHKKRHGGTDTPTLLDAIGRLEKVISSISKDFPPQQTTDQDSIIPATIAAPLATSIASAPEAASETPSLSQENLQFFSNDEDLFADDTSTLPPTAIEIDSPAPEAEPVTSQATASEVSPEISAEPENPPRDRFKIFKTSPSESTGEVAKSDTQEATAEIPDPVMQPTDEEQERIVVIRNTASDDIDIPLSDDFSDFATTKNTAS